MTEPTDALLPCPFCGEAAKHSFNSLYGDMSMASCKSCGATAYAPKWNRRAVLAKWGQPAQAEEPVAREPITNGHIRAMLNKHPPEDVCDWSYRMGIDDAELHHGIKGG